MPGQIEWTDEAWNPLTGSGCKNFYAERIMRRFQPDARPMNVQWARLLRDQCHAGLVCKRRTVPTDAQERAQLKLFA